MEPIKDPAHGRWYFGYECRQCHEIVYMMEDPKAGEDRLTGPIAEAVTCSNCGFVSRVAPIDWRPFLRR
jgi:hypothetical protein